MINYEDFISGLQSTKTADNTYSYETEIFNPDGNFWCKITKSMDEEEINDLYSTLNSKYEVDPENQNPWPKFKLL